MVVASLEGDLATQALHGDRVRAPVIVQHLAGLKADGDKVDAIGGDQTLDGGGVAFDGGWGVDKHVEAA